jgi:SMC interacting uncharacterized protein involved in chromosome segregation
MLDKNDKKEIKSIVTEVVGTALEQVVLPRIQDVDDKVDKGFKEVREDIKTMKEDIKITKEDISDLHATTNRIETLVRSEVKYVDDLSGRVVKLEKKPV